MLFNYLTRIKLQRCSGCYKTVSSSTNVIHLSATINTGKTRKNKLNKNGKK
ncbi:hypothetical protein Hanom_Chr04g00337161 [Helianthus anomalus]